VTCDTLCFEKEEEVMSVVKVDRVSRYAGWLAYLSAALTIAAAVILVCQYYYALAPDASAPGGTSPEDFAHFNEKLGLVVSLFMLPLPVALHRLTSARGWGLSWLAMAFGVLGWLTITVTQTLLIITRISFEVTQPFAMVGLTLIGVWMIVANSCARAGAALSRWLTWLGEVIGASFLLAVAAITLRLVSDALAAMVVALAIPGALAFVFGFPIWLIGVGRRLLAAHSAAEQGVGWRAQPNAR
jgi:hypothetical protein